VRGFILTDSTRWLPYEITPFFKDGFFFTRIGQSKTNGIKEIMMTKNARIRRHLRLPGYSL
jgi:hypothetical protein